MEAEKKQKAPKKNWTKGLQAEFKSLCYAYKATMEAGLFFVRNFQMDSDRLHMKRGIWSR